MADSRDRGRDRDAVGDQDLLSRLGVAFAVEPVEPPAEGLAAVRRAVTERQVAQREVAGTRRGTAGARAPRPWWRQPLPVGGLVFGLVLGGSGTALAAGAPLPRPLRSLAHDVGLPVDSPQLHDVRHANRKLRHDLSTPATSPSTKRDAADLARKLAGLDADERSKVAAESEYLLGEVHDPGPGQSGQSGRSGETDQRGGGGTGGLGSGGSDSTRSGSPSGSGSTSRPGGGEGGGQDSGRGGEGGTPPTTSTPASSNTPTTAADGHRGGDGSGGSDGSDGGRGGRGGSDGSGGGGPG